MSAAKYMIGAGLVVFGSQFYHAYRKHKEDQLKEVFQNTPDKAAFFRRIHEEVAHKWDEEMDSYEWAKRIDKYRKVLCSYAEGKVLEVGIGTGRNFNFYPKRIRLVGVDWSPSMIEVCSTKEKPVYKDLLLSVMDSKELVFPQDSFDTVVGTFILSSSEDPRRVVEEMVRVCKPGGKILILDRGKAKSFLTLTHLELYRYSYIFKYGYDQCCNIKSVLSDLPVTVEAQEKKQGGHLYFYILKKN